MKKNQLFKIKGIKGIHGKHALIKIPTVIVEVNPVFKEAIYNLKQRPNGV